MPDELEHAERLPAALAGEPEIARLAGVRSHGGPDHVTTPAFNLGVPREVPDEETML